MKPHEEEIPTTINVQVDYALNIQFGILLC